MIADYAIITSFDATDLATQVKALAQKGWIPQGGVSVWQESPVTRSRLYQAMVLHEQA